MFKLDVSEKRKLFYSDANDKSRETKSWDHSCFQSMVNVLKFRTLYFILFWPKICFSCTCYLKYFVE